MEEKPPLAGRPGRSALAHPPGLRSARLSSPPRPTKPAERAPRRASKSAPPVTFQPPRAEDHHAVRHKASPIRVAAAEQPHRPTGHRKPPAEAARRARPARHRDLPAPVRVRSNARARPRRTPAAAEQARTTARTTADRPNARPRPAKRTSPADRHRAHASKERAPAKSATDGRREGRAHQSRTAISDAGTDSRPPAKATPHGTRAEGVKPPHRSHGNQGHAEEGTSGRDHRRPKAAPPAAAAPTEPTAGRAQPRPAAPQPSRRPPRRSSRAHRDRPTADTAQPEDTPRSPTVDAAAAAQANGPMPAARDAEPTVPAAGEADAKPAESPGTRRREAPDEDSGTARRTEAWAKLIADPGHAPELLALAAVQTIGPRAEDWAARIREPPTRPPPTPASPAWPTKQFTRVRHAWPASSGRSPARTRRSLCSGRPRSPTPSWSCTWPPPTAWTRPTGSGPPSCWSSPGCIRPASDAEAALAAARAARLRGRRARPTRPGGSAG